MRATICLMLVILFVELGLSVPVLWRDLSMPVRRWYRRRQFEKGLRLFNPELEATQAYIDSIFSTAEAQMEQSMDRLRGSRQADWQRW